MRIAQIAPSVERVPPKKYGGTERVVHALTEALVARGHDVTLFASGDSITSAKLVSVYPRSLREARLKDLYGPNILTLHEIGIAYQLQDEFDIIHDHTGYLSLPTANVARTPSVFTYHGPITREVAKIFRSLRKPFVVTISQAQRSHAPDLHHAATVYNGLPMEHFPFSAEHDGYLLFVGRISIEKGPHLAIEVAQELDLPLIIAAKLDDADKPYFREYVEPRLSEQIRWIGEVDETERNRLMSRALCLLHPVTWPEPFGLTLIEAMACGCPVIALDKGSVREVVKHGETGFVVSDLYALIGAVEDVGSIDRSACRAHSLREFNSAKMVDAYEEIYRNIVSGELT